MNTQTTKIAITFPTVLAQRLRQKAGEQYGFDLAEIVRKLAADYVDEPSDFIEYVSKSQEAQYEEDWEETKSLMAKGKITPASSIKELRNQIEQE